MAHDSTFHVRACPEPTLIFCDMALLEEAQGFRPEEGDGALAPERETGRGGARPVLASVSAAMLTAGRTPATTDTHHALFTILPLFCVPSAGGVYPGNSGTWRFRT